MLATISNARRKFWEMCASRSPVAYEIDVNHETSTHYIANEDPEDIARWADRMLEEWDKRWTEKGMNP